MSKKEPKKQRLMVKKLGFVLRNEDGSLQTGGIGRE
jgi:hypothetical protein